MPKLSALFDANETAEFDLEWMGEQVRITYSPALVSPDVVDKMGELNESNPDLTQGEAWMALLCPALRDWDLEDDDGQVVPIEPDVLGSLPTPFLRAILVGMQEAVRPTRRRTRSSRGSSTRKR